KLVLQSAQNKRPVCCHIDGSRKSPPRLRRAAPASVPCSPDSPGSQSPAFTAEDPAVQETGGFPLLLPEMKERVHIFSVFWSREGFCVGQLRRRILLPAIT